LCMAVLAGLALFCSTADGATKERTLPTTRDPAGADGAPRDRVPPDNAQPPLQPSATLLVTPLTVGNFALGKDGALSRLRPALGEGAVPADQPVCVFVATDLRFELFASAGGAELVSATLCKLPTCLTLFDNGSGKKGADGLTVARYDAQGNPSPNFKGFWWHIDATTAARWRGVAATAVFRRGHGPSAPAQEAMTNTVCGVNEAVTKLRVQAWSGCTIIQGGQDDGNFTIVFQGDAKVAEILYTADTTFGNLRGQISWQVDKKTVPVVGPRLVGKIRRGENPLKVVAWGDAPNILGAP